MPERTYAGPTRPAAGPTTLSAGRGWGPLRSSAPAGRTAADAARPGHDFGSIAVRPGTASPAAGNVVQCAHRKYQNPQQGVTAIVPRKPVTLYRSMAPDVLKQMMKGVEAGKGPALQNKRSPQGKPVGENFFASSEEYARVYEDKGTRKGGTTLRFRLDPGIRGQLLHNPRFARAHESVVGDPQFKGIPRAKKDERGTVMVKKERIGKSKFRMSTNYGIRESEDPSSADNPYATFSRAIRSIHALPHEEPAAKGKQGKQEAAAKAGKPQLLYRRPTLPVFWRRRKAAKDPVKKKDDKGKTDS